MSGSAPETWVPITDDRSRWPSLRCQRHRRPPSRGPPGPPGGHREEEPVPTYTAPGVYV